MEDVPMPTPGPDDLLIKIRKTSICGTDLHLYKWDAWAAKNLPLPAIIGHEFVGEIVEVGKHVHGFSVGQRISGEGHLTCGDCRFCRMGRRVLCPNTVGLGYNCDGCFAEYFTLPAKNAFPIPEEIPDEIATIFDPFGNAVHTALFFDLVGKDVLITGAGPIGLMAILIAKRAGARNVVITDLNPYRLYLAEMIGASRAVNLQNSTIEEAMKSLGVEEGFDVSLEMSGSPQALASLPKLTLNGGKIVLLGILPSEATLDWHDVIFKMQTIQGIYGREIFQTWYQATHLIQSGLDLTPIITHGYPAEEFQKGFDVMLSGLSGKVILNWS